MQEFYRLDNGVRVYLWQWPTTSVGITVTLDSGSRHDPLPNIFQGLLEKSSDPPLYGLNHKTEHLTARATKKWKSWEELTEHADATCSDQNAETDKTTMAVYAATDRQHAPSTIDFLADMMLHPIISQENFATEQQRVLQECREYADQPNEQASLMFDQLMFGQDGLAHPILGTEESIQRITIEHVRNFRKRVVCGERIIVTVAGNFNPEKVKLAIRKAFGGLRRGLPREVPTLDYRQLRGGIRLSQDDTNQVYCILGWPMFGLNHADRYAMSVLHNHVSGDNRGSSRIKVATSSQGYGYSALDGFTHWPDIGQWHLDIPVSPDRFLETMRKIAEVIGDVRTTLISRRHHFIATQNLTIGARSRFGDPLRTATFIGAFMANAGTFTPLRQYIQGIRQVSRHRIRKVARDVFVHKRLCVVAHGPVQGITKAAVRRALAWK